MSFSTLRAPLGGLRGLAVEAEGGGALFIRADVAAKTFELSFGAKANMLTERTRTDDVHAVSCIRRKAQFLF